jgi:spermidine synthase
MYSSLPYVGGALTMVAVGLVARIDLPRVSVETSAGEKLVSVSEGPHGVTAVVERPGSRRLKLNNHYGLGGTASTGDERMQAHIPLLLHPAPDKVAFLGLGTGITAGGALFHPVKSLTIIELVPDVIDAAREHFGDANQNVVGSERTRIVADDARHALRSGRARYDVIVGDLVVPWRQGEGALFTLEQFEAARNALAPRGIFCQWLPLFQLSEAEVNIICRTFLQVFPRAQVWRGDFSPTEPAIALIGSNEPIAFDPAGLTRRLAQMRPDPMNPQLQSAENFWMNYIGELDASQISAAETRLNVDDQPWVEILGPLLHTGGNLGNLFVGRGLQRWERMLTQRSQRKVGALPPADQSAVEAGDALAEMTLCLSEENPTGAKAAQAKLRELLPAEAFQELF